MGADILVPQKLVDVGEPKTCDVCAMLGKSPANPASYDSPLTMGGRTTWGYSCHVCYVMFASSNAHAVGCQITWKRSPVASA